MNVERSRVTLVLGAGALAVSLAAGGRLRAAPPLPAVTVHKSPT